MKKIKLTQGKYALVDDEDFGLLNQWKWHTAKHRNSYYATTSIKTNNKWKTIGMHRQIMQTPKGMETDHINGNTLDNRKNNLRVCTHSENQRNRVQHRSGRLVGYYKFKRKTKKGFTTHYIAQRLYKGKPIYLGCYKTPEEAHQVFIKSYAKYKPT